VRALGRSGLALLALVALPGVAALAGRPAGATAPTEWTVYHNQPAGTGLDTSGADFTGAHAAWTSPTLDGQLFGEPVVAAGLVVVATENDTVYALSSAGGNILWSRHLGPPVPSTDLPCGNISPSVGITGTPVVDPGRGEVFVVADELVSGAPEHELVGLNLSSGAVELTVKVDPAGSTPAALLQRTGLALDGDRVVFGFGGNYGDCGDYHGWLVSVNEAGGSPIDYQFDSGGGEKQGAVWLGGAAPEIDGSGDIWVAAGNGSATSASDPYDGSDSVVQLSSSLHRLQYFAPSNWYAQNSSDGDLGSSAPALLADGLVVQAGKTQTAYLLQASDLGGIGGQRAELPSICGDDVDGGDAVSGTTVFLPCRTGLLALSVTASPPALHVLWKSPHGGDPPIIASGLVWTLGSGGTLFGLNPANGALEQQLVVGPAANHFPTPSVGADMLFATAATTVHAFAGAAATPTTTTSATAPTTTTTEPPTTTTSAAPPPPSGGGWPLWATVALVAAAVGLGVGGYVFFTRRRRPSP